MTVSQADADTWIASSFVFADGNKIPSGNNGVSGKLVRVDRGVIALWTWRRLLRGRRRKIMALAAVEVAN
jgi:hypothetical protein